VSSFLFTVVAFPWCFCLGWYTSIALFLRSADEPELCAGVFLSFRRRCFSVVFLFGLAVWVGTPRSLSFCAALTNRSCVRSFGFFFVLFGCPHSFQCCGFLCLFFFVHILIGGCVETAGILATVCHRLCCGVVGR
jgi:hypothetical protein